MAIRPSHLCDRRYCEVGAVVAAEDLSIGGYHCWWVGTVLHEVYAIGSGASMETVFNSTPDPTFAEAVERFPWRKWDESGVQVGWVAAGDCPACGHVMALYRRSVRRRRPRGAVSIRATCNCLEPHPGRPEGVRQGCGQSALLDLATWEASRSSPGGSE
jgi:hypothetical protein